LASSAIISFTTKILIWRISYSKLFSRTRVHLSAITGFSGCTNNGITKWRYRKTELMGVPTYLAI